MDPGEQHQLEINQAILAIFTALLNEDVDTAMDIVESFDHIICLCTGMAEYGLAGLMGLAGSKENAQEMIQKAALMLASAVDD